MDKIKAPEGAQEVEKEYHHALADGTKIKVIISADVTNLTKENVEDICSAFSVISRSFYLHLGTELNNRL